MSWIKVLRRYYQAKRFCRDLMGLEKQLYVRDRADFYRDLWKSAAEKIGAEFRPLTSTVWDVKCNGHQTRLDLYQTELDNPVTLRVSGNKALCHQILRDGGYATGYAGKWHLNGAGKPQWAPKRNFGFDDNRFMFNRGHWKKLVDTDDGPRVDSRNAKGRPNYGLNGADENTFTTDWLTNIQRAGVLRARTADPRRVASTCRGRRSPELPRRAARARGRRRST